MRAAAALFFTTGAAGLIYQTVWMRMLIRVFGVTVYATTTVVAIFMAGLAIGAWIGGRVSSKRAPSLGVWGAVEIAAGCAALISTFAIRALPAFYGSFGGDAGEGAPVLLRLALSSACLLPPTMLMGATLPLLVAWVEAGPEHGRGVSVLYGVNTFGAVAGVVFCGFVGLALLGETRSVLVAVLLHVVAGAYGLWRPSPREWPPDVAAPASVDSASADALLPAWVLAFAAVVSGLCAIGCEIAWTRLLVFLVGSSVYGFASMLGMFLVGIGAGSLYSPRVSSRALPALFALAGICALASLRVFLFLGLRADDARYLYSPLIQASDAFRFFATSALVVLPLTFVSGVTFPHLVLAAQRSGAHKASNAVGRVYAFNTVGSVCGALGAGFVLLPAYGAQGSIFIAANVFFITAVVLALVSRKIASRASVAFAVAAAFSLAWLAPSADVTREILARRLERTYGMKIVKHTETIDTTVTIAASSDPKGPQPALFLNGVATSSRSRAGEVMAHLPLIVQDDPQRALVICFGVGSTFSAASEHVDHVDAVELVEEVIASFQTFNTGRAHFLSRPGNRIFIDDGRNFLLRSREKWDAIMIDGAPPIYAPGFVNLYSKENVELAKEHLTDTGVLMLWIPAPSWAGDIWAMVRAATEVFPHTAMWATKGPGVILLASKQPIDLSREHLDARINANPRLQAAAPWFTSSFVYEQGTILDDAAVRERAAKWPMLRDDTPITEFPLAHLLADEPTVDIGEQLLR